MDVSLNQYDNSAEVTQLFVERMNELIHECMND